jgi:3-hydroxybutyryl-CoA dehydrogenase
MWLVILGNEQQKEEILSGGIKDDCKVDWIKTSAELSEFDSCDALIDLLFEENEYDGSHLKNYTSKPVIVNSVIKTTKEIGIDVIRINGWPGFLKRPVAEISCSDANRTNAETILNAFNKKTEFVPDIRGFVSSRVISMIINEAYFALEENVSTKKEIDTAMKLGTNYPYGPFEWAEKIGLKNIVSLLTELSLTENRYQPAGLLLKEAIE